MIVEDDPAIRRLYSFLLTNSGYNVLEAEDGLEALERYDQEDSKCDLIITDMNMPRMGGMELVKELRKRSSEVYVIMVTAYGTPDTERLARSLGANEYIAKPFDFEELEARVRLYFEQFKGTQQAK
ncbi:MAG: response regulator [Chloroflexaceae bacterium]|nr:response regulator [Chloroflexaceae bacterium]